jgi:hypothetical protein
MIKRFVFACALAWTGPAVADSAKSLPLLKSADDGAGVSWFVEAKGVAAGDLDAPQTFGLREGKSHVSGGLSYERPVGAAWKLGAEGALTLSEDHLPADKDASSWRLEGSLGWDPKKFAVAPFGSYGLEATYLNRFERYESADRTGTLGVKLNQRLAPTCPEGKTQGWCASKLGLAVTPSWSRIWSDDPAHERQTPGVVGELTGVAPLGVGLRLQAKHEERRFLNLDPEMEEKRRDKRTEVYAGARVQDLVQLVFKVKPPYLDKIELGGRWTANSSNSPRDSDSYHRWQFIVSTRFGGPVS